VLCAATILAQLSARSPQRTSTNIVNTRHENEKKEIKSEEMLLLGFIKLPPKNIAEPKFRLRRTVFR
jgi:hypothetical protein